MLHQREHFSLDGGYVFPLQAFCPRAEGRILSYEWFMSSALGGWKRDQDNALERSKGQSCPFRGLLGSFV